MYCSKNIVRKALGEKTNCDKSNCDNCRYYCNDKSSLVEMAYWIIQERDLNSLDITKINGYIKMLD